MEYFFLDFGAGRGELVFLLVFEGFFPDFGARVWDNFVVWLLFVLGVEFTKTLLEEVSIGVGCRFFILDNKGEGFWEESAWILGVRMDGLLALLLLLDLSEFTRNIEFNLWSKEMLASWYNIEEEIEGGKVTCEFEMMGLKEGGGAERERKDPSFLEVWSSKGIISIGDLDIILIELKDSWRGITPSDWPI